MDQLPMVYEQPIQLQPAQFGFDYSLFEPEIVVIAKQFSARIQGRMIGVAQAYIDNGKDLIAAKEKIPHGLWVQWIEAEFNWSRITANKMMRVAHHFGHLQFATSSVSSAALLMLARDDI